MSNTLIDMDKLAERVKEHLGEINLHHVSYVEVIKLLLDEMDKRQDHLKAYIEAYKR